METSVMKKRLAGAVLVVLLFCLAFSGQAETVGLNSRGKAVIDLKQRLFDLGYYDSLKNITDVFTKDTAEKVRAFQAANGLPETGEADAATLAALYAPEVVKVPLDPERLPPYNLQPDVAVSFPADLPARDEQGFLLDAESPFVYQSREAGVWLYLSATMQAQVIRYYQTAGKLEWFEAYIRYKDGGKPQSIESKSDGKGFQSPLKMLEGRGDIILAITDDFYRYREEHNQRVGIVVRDGQIKSDRTYAQNHARIPPLEVLAMFADGSMKTFDSDAHTAREYIDMGVTDTWAFGPALVQGGEVPRYFYSEDYRSYREPRCALGMVAPGSYCALIITGRKEDSKGAYFGWMAEKMKEMGAVEALNLDGGGTTALVFMGELLNHSPKSQNSRPLSGLIGFAE